MQMRTIREARGITQTELAKLAKVSQPNISDVENGKVSPTVATASRLAKALNCTVDDLLGDAEQKPTG